MDLELAEWAPTECPLSEAEAHRLKQLPAGLAVELGESPGSYLITPSSTVGAYSDAKLRLTIHPKVGVARLFRLLSYASGLTFPHHAELEPESDLTEAFVATFLGEVRRLLRRGPIRSYRSVDDAVIGFRGRLRSADQLQRRFGFPIPTEVTYDEFTIDVDENRVLKAALRRLARLRLSSSTLRGRLGEAIAALDGVAEVRYTRQTLPTFHYTRLNDRYRPVLELSRLVLADTSLELRLGETAIGGFFIDMNRVFEEFVYRALGERLSATGTWRRARRLYLDVDNKIRLEPDLSLWRGRTCLFVGDAKYKATVSGENSDLYQLLAYCRGTGLRQGLLIYATASTPEVFEVRHGGTLLRVEGLNLEAPWAELVQRLDALASLVREMAAGPRVKVAA